MKFAYYYKHIFKHYYFYALVAIIKNLIKLNVGGGREPHTIIVHPLSYISSCPREPGYSKNIFHIFLEYLGSQGQDDI